MIPHLVKIEIEENILKKIISKIFKEYPICIDVIDSEKNSFTYRTFRSQLKQGIIVKPFLSNTEDIINYFNGNINSIESFSIKYCNGSYINQKSIKYFYCD